MATAVSHEVLVGGAVGRQPSGRAGFVGAMRSEFTKIRSVRSTYWTLLALVLACVGIGALFSWGQTQRILRFEHGTTFRGGKVPPGFAEHIANEIRSQAASISLFGLLIGQLIIIVLGALAITSEYSTGMIRTSLTAMPRRGTVFAAKGVVFGFVALVVGLVTSFLAFFVGQADPVHPARQHHARASERAAHRDRRRPVPRRVRAAVVRDRRDAQAHGGGHRGRHRLMFVLWILSQFLPGPPSGWFGQDDIDKWIPFNAGSAIWENQANGLHPFSPWIGFGGVLRVRRRRGRRRADRVPSARRVMAAGALPQRQDQDPLDRRVLEVGQDRDVVGRELAQHRPGQKGPADVADQNVWRHGRWPGAAGGARDRRVRARTRRRRQGSRPRPRRLRRARHRSTSTRT